MGVRMKWTSHCDSCSSEGPWHVTQGMLLDYLRREGWKITRPAIHGENRKGIVILCPECQKHGFEPKALG